MVLPVIDIAAADNYFATSPRDAQWGVLDDIAKDAALNEAQLWLGQLCWDTTADCCGNDFTTSYTRAVSELALALNANPTALISGAAASGALGPVKRQKLDVLEVEYFDPRGSGSTTATPTARGPLVLRTFPWLKDMLSCWLSGTGSSSLLYRVRS